jgi:hypothetical protein
MPTHRLSEDITAASIESFESHDCDSAFLHFDNGVVLAFNAVIIEGVPVLAVTRVTEIIQRATH